MEYRNLVLDLARLDDRLRVACYERNGIHESTLRPYEFHPVAWDQIDKECREILGLFARGNRHQRADTLASLKRSGHLLFDLLLPQSAKAKLERARDLSLTLCLDDNLIHIPWQLLYDGREFFCRRFALGRVVHTRQAGTSRSEREPSPPFSVLILADPRGDLPAAYREGIALRNVLDGHDGIFHVDFKSCPVDVAFVKRFLREYDIVHYAGHAVYHADNPTESGWLLEDGTLSASAIVAMGGLRPMPALVFANACQSAGIDGFQDGADYGDRIYGLANAFLIAGVGHYIGSFGEVLDETGGVFAQSFYRALAEGNEVGMALREARLASIDRFGEEQLNWASYMLYGAPNRGFLNRKNIPRDRAERSPVLRGEETNRATKKARSWMVASLLLSVGLLGSLVYALFPSQPQKVPLPPPAAMSSVMEASTLSNAPSEGPLRLSMLVLGQKKAANGKFTETIIRDGGSLRSGDQFQVRLRVDRNSFVYVILYDSRGRVSKLFPDPKLDTPGFVNARTDITIPDKHLWFWLDTYPGTETLYALASLKPLKNIAKLLDNMQSAHAAVGKPNPILVDESSIKGVQRGVGGIAQNGVASSGISDSDLIKKVTAVVVATGAVVRIISFQHE